MKIGDKILSLRKEKGLTQEQLAEKLNVTRQTISNWEVNETTPDIIQAKNLAIIFSVSLDELVGSNQGDKILLPEKKLSLGTIILIILCSLMALFIGYIMLASIMFTKVSSHKTEEVMLECQINKEDYFIEIASDGYFNCSNCPMQMQQDIKNIIDYADINKSSENVITYYESKNGSCK